MKSKHLMGSMLLMGILLIPAHRTDAGILANAGNTNVIIGRVSGLLGEIQNGSVSQSTALFVQGGSVNFDVFSSDVPRINTADQKHVTKIRITAYTSNPDETDSTPLITASGVGVRDGIIATNFLPFGTTVRIPSLFGNKIFTVEDRMNLRYRHSIDIWMPDVRLAMIFGVRLADIEILSSVDNSQELALSI